MLVVPVFVASVMCVVVIKFGTVCGTEGAAGVLVAPLPGPGEEVDLDVTAIAPNASQSGRQYGHWVLVGPDGRRFGPVFAVDMWVEV